MAAVIGLLLSLGAASAVANVIGGIVMVYMRPFQIGDRVKIADTAGDVLEKRLLVTRVRTIKNVDITIPNSMVRGSHIINYSTASTAGGLILHTTLTIGYDVPWRTVHECSPAPHLREIASCGSRGRSGQHPRRALTATHAER